MSGWCLWTLCAIAEDAISPLNAHGAGSEQLARELAQTEQIPTTFQIAGRLNGHLLPVAKNPAGPFSGPAGCFSDPGAAELLELAEVAAELVAGAGRPAGFPSFPGRLSVR